MITISRLLARRLRTVFRPALSLTPSLFTQPIQFVAGPEGLRVTSQRQGFAACYYDSTTYPECKLTIPFSLLKEVDGGRDEPVYLVTKSNGRVLAHWQGGAVPQELIVEVPADQQEVELPVTPQNWTENPTELRQALATAAQFVDTGSARYALGCIQLRGKHGDISATDGRQIFQQRGFQFGTDQELLVRPSSLFSAKELIGELPVQFGITDEHAVFGLDAWRFWLPLEKEGRFPRIDEVIPAERSVVTTLELSHSDTVFLAENLKRLPGSETSDQPVTLDLNGWVAIRSRNGDEGSVTELRLSNSVRSGNEICVQTNRRYLERAAQLGFQRLGFVAPEAPIVCREERRTYVWAVLEAKGAVPADKAVVIQSPLDSHKATRKSRTKSRLQRIHTMSARPKAESSPSTKAEPVSTPVNSAAGKEPSVIEQALALRDLLRNTLSSVNRLVLAIKRQKKQEKFLRSTLASLKDLQSVA